MLYRSTPVHSYYQIKKVAQPRISHDAVYAFIPTWYNCSINALRLFITNALTKLYEISSTTQRLLIGATNIWIL